MGTARIVLVVYTVLSFAWLGLGLRIVPWAFSETTYHALRDLGIPDPGVSDADRRRAAEVVALRVSGDFVRWLDRSVLVLSGPLALCNLGRCVLAFIPRRPAPDRPSGS
jgi:hypothetical protein